MKHEIEEKKGFWASALRLCYVIVLLFLVPAVASTQMVPVIDAKAVAVQGNILKDTTALLTAFNNYVSLFKNYQQEFKGYRKDFDNYVKDFNNAISKDTDSVRNLIAAGNPGGRAKEACATGADSGANGRGEAFAYKQGSWASSSAAVGTAELPDRIPAAKSNTSGSLRCLLQEIIRWQRLDLNLQIHGLLKKLISDAQTKQLNNQLNNKVSAAALNWAKAGVQVTNNGVVTTEPVYMVNLNQSIYNINQRQLDHFAAQAVAAPGTGAVGSANICEPWRLSSAANAVRQNQNLVQDPFYLSGEVTGCSIPNSGRDYAQFSESFNSTGMEHWIGMFSGTANTPADALYSAGAIAQQRIADQEQSTRDKLSLSNIQGIDSCSGRPDDPYCLARQNSTQVTPKEQVASRVTTAASQGDKQIENADATDATGGSVAQRQSTELLAPEGMLGYNETNLALSQTVVTRLVKEFYDTMETGYWYVDEQGIDWAQATMLSIYDMMKFDGDSTEVVVTAGTAPAPTGYGE